MTECVCDIKTSTERYGNIWGLWRDAMSFGASLTYWKWTRDITAYTHTDIWTRGTADVENLIICEWIAKYSPIAINGIEVGLFKKISSSNQPAVQPYHRRHRFFFSYFRSNDFFAVLAYQITRISGVNITTVAKLKAGYSICFTHFPLYLYLFLPLTLNISVC